MTLPGSEPQVNPETLPFWEASANDVDLRDFFGRFAHLGQDVPVDSVPACILGRAPREAPRVLDTAMMTPEGRLEIFRYTRRYILEGYRTKSLRCTECKHFDGCGAGVDGRTTERIRIGVGGARHLPGPDPGGVGLLGGGVAQRDQIGLGLEHEDRDVEVGAYAHAALDRRSDARGGEGDGTTPARVDEDALIGGVEGLDGVGVGCQIERRLGLPHGQHVGRA